MPAFPVDTHIHRLASRLHLQIIFYGREHCSARGCDGKSCLLCRELFSNG